MAKLKSETVKLADGTEATVLRLDASGKFTYIDDSGAEKPGDFLGLLGTLKSTLDERTKIEERAKTAETTLATYQPLGPPDEIGKSLDMVKALKAGDLKTIEDVRKLQEEAALKERSTWEGKLKAEEQKAAQLRAEIEDAALLNLCNTVAGAKRKDAMGKEIPIFAAPGDGLKLVFKDHCRRDEKGNWQFTRTPGRFDSSDIILHEFQPAPPEIAFQELAKGKDWLLYKPQGAGSGHGNDGGGGGDASKSDNPAHLIATGLGIQAA